MQPDIKSVTAGEQNEALVEIEREMQRIASPLPEVQVGEFSPPRMFTPHRIRPAEARALFLEALGKEPQLLSKGVTPERAVENVRPVFVPRWLISGDISGKWSATGIETESWEVDCPDCLGSGKVGTGTLRRDCPTCWGSGKEKQTKKSKRPESGEAAAVINESLDNNGSGISLELDLDRSSEPLPIPEADLNSAHFRCIRPTTIYHSAAADTLKNRLATAIEEQAKSTLGKYSRIDGFQFEGETIKSQSAVAVWLYPAYLCSFEGIGAQQFAACDAVTGKISFPKSTSQPATSGKAAEAGKGGEMGRAATSAQTAQAALSASASQGTQQATPASHAPAGTSSRLTIIAVVILLILAGAGWYLWKGHAANAAPDHAPASSSSSAPVKASEKP